MEDLNNENLIVNEEIDSSIENSENQISEINDENSNNNTTAIIEYKEIEEPCVALTIIGENKLTNTEVFIKRGVKFSIKAFFSGLVLTIMNMFI